jgi:hypothetical protein
LLHHPAPAAHEAPQAHGRRLRLAPEEGVSAGPYESDVPSGRATQPTQRLRNPVQFVCE